jgi:hypothetical protein
MKKHIFSLAVLALALPLAGCSSPSLPVEEASDKPLASRLGDSIDLSLADLLTKPRVQLAEMADEWATRIQIQEKGRREGRLPFSLIPSLRLPLAVPVLRQAHLGGVQEQAHEPGPFDWVFALETRRLDLLADFGVARLHQLVCRFAVAVAGQVECQHAILASFLHIERQAEAVLG